MIVNDLQQASQGGNSFSEKRKLTSVETVCLRIDEIMKKISAFKSNDIYDINTHLYDLKLQEKLNIEEINQRVSLLLGVKTDLIYTDGEAFKKALVPIALSDVKPVADQELLEEAKQLEGNVSSAKKVFEEMNEELLLEIENARSNYAFSTFQEALSSFHKIYNKYTQTFSWIKTNYQIMSDKLEARNKSDQEKTPPINGGFLSGMLYNDPVKVRKDILDTLDYLYNMEEGQSSKDMENFHVKTDLIFKRLIELNSVYKEYKDAKRLAKRNYCYLAYLCNKGIRPGSYGDHFDNEYNNGNHRFFKTPLAILKDS